MADIHAGAIILSSVCGKHFDDKCQSCQSAKESNDTRLQAPQEPDDDALEQIAEFLVEQRNEPWPGGTDATRLHYWRDKAIEGARRLRALRAPETGEG